MIVGGANSAGQAALHLAEHAAEVTILVRGDSLERGMSHYLVERIERHGRISVRTHTEVTDGGGDDRLESVTVTGPAGEQTLPADALFVLIGAAPLTAGVEDWLRCDEHGYFMTGRDLFRSSDRSWWPLERDPLFLESSQPGLFVAGDVRSRLGQARGLGGRRGRDGGLARPLVSGGRSRARPRQESAAPART